MPPRLQVEAAVFGNLPELMQEEQKRGAAAVSHGVDKTRLALLAELRGQVLAAFGSQRLANTWRGNTYPRAPQTSLGAAATVFSRAPHIVEAFQQATTIRGRNGAYLAIPSPDVPRSANRRLTPDNWPKERFGPLRFVYRRGKSSLLVVDEVGRTAAGKVGRQRQRTKSGGYRKGTASVVMFYLVPMVRLKQRLDPQAAYLRALDQLVGNILSAWNQAE